MNLLNLFKNSCIPKTGSNFDSCVSGVRSNNDACVSGVSSDFDLDQSRLNTDTDNDYYYKRLYSKLKSETKTDADASKRILFPGDACRGISKDELTAISDGLRKKENRDEIDTLIMRMIKNIEEPACAE